MSDADVAKLLRSDEPLVVIEAPAGCGKTHQGAEYAKDIIPTLNGGRLLILAHTHAACDVFHDRTRGASSKVEIKTISSFMLEIADAYHKTLSLPPNPEKWAWKDKGKGYELIAKKCAGLLAAHPMIARALVRRYPIVICDEHQDCSADQHAILAALLFGGAKLRIFADPLQRLFTGKKPAQATADAARWEKLVKESAFAKLDYPHRWEKGSPALGKWILDARKALLEGSPIIIPNPLPKGLNILYADNRAPKPRARAMYQLDEHERKPIDATMLRGSQMLVLGIGTARVQSLTAFTNRRIGVWEGQTREDLSVFVEAVTAGTGNAESIGKAFMTFVSAVTSGFSMASHGNRFIKEITEGCSMTARGMPAALQAMSKLVISEPNHVGAANAMKLLADYIERREKGFDKVRIDYKREFSEAIRIGSFSTPEDGFAELARRRIQFRRPLPMRIVSTIHKAKGLEVNNAMLIPCDGGFTGTYYSKCRLYVAISRAKQTLTLVVPTNGASPLLK